MRTNMSELIDLALTQAIERYMEMEPDAVYEAIAHEWPEQMAVILTEFMFRTTCGLHDETTTFIQVPRAQGGSTFLIPLCRCDWSDE